MIGATPNQQYVDALAREIRSRYAPARLAERTTEELRDARRMVDAEIDRFVAAFPEEEPAGHTSAGASPGDRPDRRPLSASERERLQRLRSETKLAIDRELDSRTDEQDGPGRRFSRSRAALGLASDALSEVVHLSPRRR